jgi:hypothetical protein
MIVVFTSTNGNCHGMTMTVTIGRSKSDYHAIMTMTAIIGSSVYFYL